MSWEQVGNSITFVAQFTASGAGATGLTITCTVYKVSTGGAVVTAQSATEIGGGVYKYTLASGAVDAEDDYLAVFNEAAATSDLADVPALWIVGHAGVENLDAAVSSRSSHSAADVWASGTRTLTSFGSLAADTTTAVWAAGSRTLTSFGTLVSDTATAVWAAGTRTLTSISALAAQIAAAVLDATASSYNTASTIGELINASGSASDPLLNAVPGSYAGGTAGFALGRIGTADITVQSPVALDGTTLELVRGDDYLEADDRQLSFSSDDWPDLTAADIVLTIRRRAEAFTTGGTSDPVLLSVVDASASRVAGSGTQTVVFELNSAAVGDNVGDTGDLLPGTATGKYDIEATLADESIVTLALGTVTVYEDQTREA